jgi:signal transduction histidine kinase
MSERAHLFGGRVEIQGTEGKGTTVTVHIPDIAGRFENAPRKERLTPPH